MINWEPLATFTGTEAQVKYHIYRATAAVGPYSEIGVSTGRYTISYIDKGTVAVPLWYKTRYWYRIAAEDAGGLNLTPQYMTGTPTGVTAEALMSPTTGPPIEPRGLEVTSTVSGSTVQKVTLSWLAVTGPNVLRYDVWRLTESGSDGTYIGSTANGTTTTFDDTVSGLEVERHYWYRVAAVASDGTVGAKSFEIHIQPMANTVFDPPHSGASPTGDSCLQCHDPHVAPSPTYLLNIEAGSEQEFCTSCHDGTGSRYDICSDFVNASVNSRHPVDFGGWIGGDLTCTDCHNPHGDPSVSGSYKLLSAYGEVDSIEYCLVCHNPSTPDDSTYTERTRDMTAFRNSSHNGPGIADPPSGTGIKCRTCHLPHSSPNEDLLMYSGYRVCLPCHSNAPEGASLGSPDIYARMTASSRLDAHHDILRRDQIQPGAGAVYCENCHNSHAASSAAPCINPYDPAPWNPYPNTVAPAFAAITNLPKNSFCFECHDNSLPSSIDTTPWVDPPVWSDSDNNGNTTSDLANITSNWASQRHGKGSTINENVWPDVTTLYGANPEMPCSSCHEAHGAVNLHNLRSDIAGRTGLMVVNMPQVTGGSGYDTRFWCMGCHKDANATHTSGGKTWATFPKDCSRGGTCHTHTNSAGQF
ncbi:MAG: cytochrome c3 family protein [Actinomycetota bacterium]|nr:cytochrome c3 family protein [Actinomycetota bacterium]